MVRHDPISEAEISERSFEAMSREAEALFVELHKRIIEARNQARFSELDNVLGRIDSVLHAA